MKCLKCNVDLSDGVLFCTNCGASVNVSNENMETFNVINPVQQPNDINNVIQGSDTLSENTNNVSDSSMNAFQQNNNVVLETVNSQVSINNNVDMNQNNMEYNQPVNNSSINQEVSKGNINMVENNVVVKEFNDNSNNIKKKSNSPIIIAVIIILLLVGVCIGGYFLLFNSPKKVFTSTLDKAYKSLSLGLNSDKVETVSTTFDFKTNVKANDKEANAIFNIINNISLNGKIEMDYNKKVGNIELNSTYESDELIKIDAKLNNGKVYVLLKNVYDKYISSDVDGYDTLFETGDYSEDYNIIVSEVINALNSSLKDEYFHTEKTNINIDGKDVSVKKNILSIDEETFITMYVSTLTSLKENDKFLDSFSKVSETTKDDVISMIEDEIELYDYENSSDGITIEFVIYTEGLFNNFVGIELSLKDTESTGFKVLKSGENTYTFDLMSTDNKITGKISIAETNDKTTLVFNINVDGDEIGFELTYSVKYNENITVENVNDSVDFNYLTDEEYSTIMTNLMNNAGIQKIMSAMESLYSYDNYEYSYEDYDYDYGYDSDYNIDLNYDYSY